VADPAEDNSTHKDPAADSDRAGAAKRLAFPVAKLVVSAVGISVAAWIWLGSAWRWDVTPGDLAKGSPPLALRSWPGRYVRLVGARDSGLAPIAPAKSDSKFFAYTGDGGDAVLVKRATDAPAPAGPLSGRVMGLAAEDTAKTVVVDSTRGRWNASAVMAVVIVLWGLAHAWANIHVWRRRREATQARRG